MIVGSTAFPVSDLPPLGSDIPMTEKSPDDIFALCSRFDLDQESYRVFPKRKPIVHFSNNPEPSVTAPLESERSSSDSEEDRAPAGQISRTALRNLWRHIELSEGKGKTLSFNDLLKSSVFVYGTAGGVGATTVSATLAHLFAKEGRGCAVVDDRNESVLPFFFGGQRAISDGKRYPGLHAASGTEVRIITRKTHDTDLTENETGGQPCWLERSVSLVQKYLDHLVVDVQRGQEAALPAVATPVALLVAVPDVSSLVGARALKRTLSEKASGSKLICVLNKFDSAQALHMEIRGWFKENFSQVLTLRRSDLIDEALAEGLTVVDWAPQSTIAADFLHLLTTIQNIMPASLDSQPQGGISLCS
ncbi:MAG: cellulose synthase operon protein YhjQ/BcsQ [Bryobacteraceae bacterium]